MTRLSARLFSGITSRLPRVQLNGDALHRYPGNLNLSFACVEGESLLMGLKQIAVSSGSACTSASLEPSYVLRALGSDDDMAHSSIRFGPPFSFPYPHMTDSFRGSGFSFAGSHFNYFLHLSGIGRFSTEKEMDAAVEYTVANVNRLRDISPLWDMVQEGVDLKTIEWNQH